jgi:hypothetical protein
MKTLLLIWVFAQKGVHWIAWMLMGIMNPLIVDGLPEKNNAGIREM